MSASTTVADRTPPDGRTIDRWARWERFLRRKGLRASHQRDAVVRAFLDVEGHVTPADLAEQVGGGVGVSTVYRALALLQEAGLAAGHAFDGQERVYEPTDPSTHHDHLVCTVCGRIEEFLHDDLEALQAEVANNLGFELTDHRLDLIGVCPDCRDEGLAPRDAG